MIILGKKYQHSARDTDLGGQTCAFGTNRVFDHLNGQDLAFKHLLFYRNRWLRIADHARRFPLRLPVPDISNMEKGRSLKTDVNKGRLHAR